MPPATLRQDERKMTTNFPQDHFSQGKQAKENEQKKQDSGVQIKPEEDKEQEEEFEGDQETQENSESATVFEPEDDEVQAASTAPTIVDPSLDYPTSADRRFLLEPNKLSDKLKELKVTSSDQLRKLKRITKQSGKRRRRKRARNKTVGSKLASAASKATQHRHGYTTASNLLGDHEEPLTKNPFVSAMKHLPALQLPSVVQKIIANKLNQLHEPLVTLSQQHQHSLTNQRKQLQKYQSERKLKQQKLEQQHQLIDDTSGEDWSQPTQKGNSPEGSQVNFGSLLRPPKNFSQHITKPSNLTLPVNQNNNLENSHGNPAHNNWSEDSQSYYPAASSPQESHVKHSPRGLREGQTSSPSEMIPVEIIGLDPSVTNSILFGGSGTGSGEQVHAEQAGHAQQAAASGEVARVLQGWQQRNEALLGQLAKSTLLSKSIPPSSFLATASRGGQQLRPVNEPPSSGVSVHIHHFHGQPSWRKKTPNGSNMQASGEASQDTSHQMSHETSNESATQNQNQNQQQQQQSRFVTNEKGEMFLVAMEPPGSQQEQVVVDADRQQTEQYGLQNGGQQIGNESPTVDNNDKYYANQVTPAESSVPQSEQLRQIQVVYTSNSESNINDQPNELNLQSQVQPNQEQLYMVAYKPSHLNASGVIHTDDSMSQSQPQDGDLVRTNHQLHITGQQREQQRNQTNLHQFHSSRSQQSGRLEPSSPRSESGTRTYSGEISPSRDQQQIISLAELADRLRASSQHQKQPIHQTTNVFANEPSSSEVFGFQSPNLRPQLDAQILDSNQHVPLLIQQANSSISGNLEVRKPQPYSHDGYTNSFIGQRVSPIEAQMNLASKHQAVTKMSNEEFLAILRNLKADSSLGVQNLNVSSPSQGPDTRQTMAHIQGKHLAGLVDYYGHNREHPGSFNSNSLAEIKLQQNQPNQIKSNLSMTGNNKQNQQHEAAGSLEEVEDGLSNLALTFIGIVSLVTLAIIVASMVYRHRRRSVSRCVDLPERGSRLNLTQRTRHFMRSNFVSPSDASSIKSVTSESPNQSTGNGIPRKSGLSSIFGFTEAQTAAKHCDSLGAPPSLTRPTAVASSTTMCQTDRKLNQARAGLSSFEARQGSMKISSPADRYEQTKEETSDIRTINTRLPSYLKSLKSSSDQLSSSNKRSESNSSTNNGSISRNRASNLRLKGPLKLHDSGDKCEHGPDINHSFRMLETCEAHAQYHNPNQHINQTNNVKRMLGNLRPHSQQGLDTIHSSDERNGLK